MSLSTDITKYVALAFDKAGSLVKTLTISREVQGAFNPATGRYDITSASTYTVEVIDNDDDERLSGPAFNNRNVRSYLVKAGELAKIGEKLTDDGIEYTVFRVSRIQQNSTIFVYEMWAEA